VQARATAASAAVAQSCAVAAASSADSGDDLGEGGVLGVERLVGAGAAQAGGPIRGQQDER
jgi:hypothetical protein